MSHESTDVRRHHAARHLEPADASLGVQRAEERDERAVLSILVCRCDDHSAHVHDRARRVDDDPARLLGRQRPWRQNESACRDWRLIVPADDVYGATVVLVHLDAAGQYLFADPPPLYNSLMPEPEGDVTLGRGRGHSESQRRRSQEARDQSIDLGRGLLDMRTVPLTDRRTLPHAIFTRTM